MSPLTIRRTILHVVAAAKPYALPQETLHQEVNRLVRPTLTLAELVKHLSWLNAQEMIGFLADEMEPENADARKWSIREAGLVALQK